MSSPPRVLKKRKKAPLTTWPVSGKYRWSDVVTTGAALGNVSIAGENIAE